MRCIYVIYYTTYMNSVYYNDDNVRVFNNVIHCQCEYFNCKYCNFHVQNHIVVLYNYTSLILHNL